MICAWAVLLRLAHFITAQTEASTFALALENRKRGDCAGEISGDNVVEITILFENSIFSAKT